MTYVTSGFYTPSFTYLL